ncbi:protein ZW2 [Arachis hypogaea]|uniref:protein ZW2 n=1 Tax=Arachis hypogaea TaxID=3818 RepID=UPI000DEC18CA|nr:transcription factor TGA7 [Arachis hypogaea]
MADANAAMFITFLEEWMVRQRNYHQELLTAQENRHRLRDSDKMELINRVLCHYEQYFEEKSKIAQRDIFLVFSPPWFSSLEKSFLWIAGFKPGKAFHLVNQAVRDLTNEQRRRLSQLSMETRMKERDLNDELAKAHESLASPPLVDTARTHGRACLSRARPTQARELEREADEGPPSELRAAMESVVTSADELRTNTALNVLQILRADQAVTFLTAVAELQLKIRSLGFEKDAQRAAAQNH